MDFFVTPSSQTQKQIEGKLFEADTIARKIADLQVLFEATAAEADEIAFEGMGQDRELADAALKMARASIPAIRQFVAKAEAAKSAAAPSSTSVAKTPAAVVVDQVISPVVPPSGDDANLDQSGDQQFSDTDGSDLNPDFFGVDVPSPRWEEAYTVLEAAKVSFRQKKKANQYPTDRGRNAWRKQLFATALSYYFENGIPGEIEPIPETATIEVFDNFPLTEQEEGDLAPISVFEGNRDENFDANLDVAVTETETETMLEQVVVPQAEIVIEASVLASSTASEHQETSQIVDSIPDFGDFDENDHDFDSGHGEYDTLTPEEFRETDAVDQDDWQPGDDAVDADAEVVVTGVSDDQTFSIGDTFFASDITVEAAEEMSLASDGDAAAEPPVTEPDIDLDATITDFDVEGEVAPSAEPQVVVAIVLDPAPVVPARPASQAPATPQMSRPRPMPGAAIVNPVHSVAPQKSEPVRPTPSPVTPAVTTPPARPTQPNPASRPTPASKPAAANNPAHAPVPPRPPAPGVPPRPVSPAMRPPAPHTHGLGNAVPAPPGLAAALAEQERQKAAAAAAAASGQPVPATTPETPPVVVRAVPAPPPRPPAPNRPSFSNPIRR